MLAFTHVLLGQAVNGTLLGTVTDSTGAAVAGAKVVATDVGTGILHQSATNESGNYTFPDLQPGIYSVTIEAKGFKKLTQQNINLLSNTTIRVDLALTLGSVTESVTVTTEPPMLQTDRADISTKLEADAVVNMPLGTNRNYQTLLNVVPGTAPAVFQHSQFFNAASTLQTEANGMPRVSNLYQIEGIDDDERTGLLQIMIPPAEAIATVDISTNNFEAELGRAIGAVINVTLKSGTNKFHGSAFEFIQNNYVNARSYFSTASLGHLSYNYFGGSVGGPIIKDKLFFFGDYLHTTDHENISNIMTIPDPRYYTFTTGQAGCSDIHGCINLLAAMNGTKGQIYDPTNFSDGNIHSGVAGDDRIAFPDNQIPYALMQNYPVSIAILQKLNAAAAASGTVAGVTSGTTYKPLNNPANNDTENVPFRKVTDSYDIKIDYTPREKDHISYRYSYEKSTPYQASAWGAFLGGPAPTSNGGFEGNGLQAAYSTGINADHVFSPSFFTELRLGVAHYGSSATPIDYGANDATTLGVPGVNLSGQPFTTGQVAVTVNGGFNNPMIGYSASLPWVRGESNIDIVNNWTKIIRNHTIKWGGDVRRIHDNLLQDQTFSARGAYTFSDVQTSDAASPGTTIANDIASFLLQQPSQSGRDVNTIFPRYRQWWIFAFASDKWQVTPKLTADIGVRWEDYPPATPAVAGGFSNYNPANDTLTMAGYTGTNNPSNLGMATDYKYFAPRLGASYRVSEKTVVRAGFGISYTPFMDNTYAYNYPIRSNNSFQPVGSSTYIPAVIPTTTFTAACPQYGTGNFTVSTLQCGFPAPVAVTIPTNGIISLPQTNYGLTGLPAVLANQLIGQVYTYIPLNFRNPYASSWNLAVQQALPFNMSLQVAYVANHGTRMSVSQNINLPKTYDGGSKSDPQYVTFGRTAATNQYFMDFSSNYNSLQAQLTKRFSHGLYFTSAVTWGKALTYSTGGDDDGSLMFFVNFRQNYAPADFDRKVNFEETFNYALPFGKGQPWLNTNKVADLIVGGWKLTGIVSIVSGLPFTASTNGSNLNTPGTTETATLTGKFNKLKGIGASSYWFDPTVFSVPNGCTGATAGVFTGTQGNGGTYTPSTCTAPVLGNTGRNQFRGPGYIQDNASIFKKFNVYHEMAAEVRFDAFQLSNTPQFGLPSSNNPTSSAFGTITSTLGSGQGSVNGIGGGRTLQGSVRIMF
jgi:hypothetical protein